MSELRADTITGSDGTSPVTLTKQIATKMRGRATADGTTLNDSFNVSGLVDTAVGRQTYNFTNAMSDALYTAHFSPGGSFCYSNAVEPNSSSQLSTRARNNLNAVFDTSVHVSVQGDLA